MGLKRGPSDLDLVTRFTPTRPGFDKSGEKKYEVFRRKAIETANEIREHVEDDDAAEAMYRCLDRLLAEAIDHFSPEEKEKTPKATRRPGRQVKPPTEPKKPEPAKDPDPAADEKTKTSQEHPSAFAG